MASRMHGNKKPGKAFDNTVRNKQRHSRTGLILEIDLGHKNKKIGLYSKSVRPLLRILCFGDDSIYVCGSNFSWAQRGRLRRHLFASIATNYSDQVFISSE